MRRILIFPLLTLAYVAPGLAAPGITPQTLTPLNTIVRYSTWWGGVRVGDMAVQVNEDNGMYAMTVLVEARGIAKLAGNYRSETKTRGTRVNGEYRQREYTNLLIHRKRERQIILRYAPDGTLAFEENLPPENRKKRPEVPAALKHQTVELLSSVLIARQQIAAALAGGPERFTLPMYDARRRYDLHYEVKGIVTKTVDETPQELVHITLARTPLAGYTENEMNRIPNEEPAVNVYLRNDSTLTPVIADGTAAFGTVVAKYIRQCSTLAECIQDGD